MHGRLPSHVTVLIPWFVQGGPGDSGSELANLGAIGPEDAAGNPRNTSWVSIQFQIQSMFIGHNTGKL